MEGEEKEKEKPRNILDLIGFRFIREEREDEEDSGFFPMSDSSSLGVILPEAKSCRRVFSIALFFSTIFLS